MMTEQPMRDCTEAELIAFVKAYPRRLEIDTDRRGDPPFITYNDFTLGMWPASIVASYNMEFEWGKPGEWAANWRITAGVPQ